VTDHSADIILAERVNLQHTHGSGFDTLPFACHCHSADEPREEGHYYGFLRCTFIVSLLYPFKGALTDDA
jgi:hypothetical protein